MARSIWKGSIHFGLVSIEIELQKAVKKQLLGFTLLHADCHTPLENKRWCPSCDREVIWANTVKGLKLPSGNYAVITAANLKKLRPHKTDTIEILEFVPIDSIQPLYYDEHYYAPSSKKTDKAYALFNKALEKLGVGAIGRLIMRDKEHLCVIQPYKQTLLLSTLHYGYEIQPVSVSSSSKVSAQEEQLAELLIKKMSKKDFKIDQYKDTFATELLKQLKQVKGKKTAVREKPAPVTGSLMHALKESLEHEAKTS